jgi:transaldolase
MTNPLRELEALGQSVWLDDIDRGHLRSGMFERLINEDGLTGATGNPTIFEHAIDHGTAYDEQMRQLIAQGKPAQAIYETLAMTDVRHVADLLRPIYDRTDGQDGFVSIEVSPYLAQDTEGTLAEVRRFWDTIDRPNLMVKIPATQAGVPAIRQALAEGINITLIFSIENYRQIAEAYLGALEERLAAGKDISRIASVASFFVSRVDVLVDKLLEDKIKAVGESAQQQQLKALEGKAASANARLAYQEFKRLFSGPRFATLKQRGGACPTAPVGQYGHEKSGLPRCAVRRGTDRSRHREHHAPHHDRALPRAWPGATLHRGPAKRGEGAACSTRRCGDPLRPGHPAVTRGGGAKVHRLLPEVVSVY